MLALSVFILIHNIKYITIKYVSPKCIYTLYITIKYVSPKCIYTHTQYWLFTNIAFVPPQFIWFLDAFELIRIPSRCLLDDPTPWLDPTSFISRPEGLVLPTNSPFVAGWDDSTLLLIVNMHSTCPSATPWSTCSICCHLCGCLLG